MLWLLGTVSTIPDWACRSLGIGWLRTHMRRFWQPWAKLEFHQVSFAKLTLLSPVSSNVPYLHQNLG